MEDRPIALTLKDFDRTLHVVAGGPGTAFAPSGCGGTEFYPPGHDSPFVVRESVDEVRKLLGWR